MTSRWEILTSEFRVLSLAHRTVKANPKPGGFTAEWSRTSLSHIESTSHIPAAFTVCMRVTECESWRRYVCVCVREFVWGEEKDLKSRQKISGNVWQEQITSSHSLWPQCRDHDSTTTADLDKCLSAMMSKARHENTWVVQLLRARCLSTSDSLLSSW